MSHSPRSVWQRVAARPQAFAIEVILAVWSVGGVAAIADRDRFWWSAVIWVVSLCAAGVFVKIAVPERNATAPVEID